MHGHRCLERQTSDSNRGQPDADPAHSSENTTQPAEMMRSLVQALSKDLSCVDKKRWLLDLLRAFHADRHPNLPANHLIRTVLTEELSKLN